MTDLPRKAVVRSAKLATVPLGFAGRTALGLGKRIGGRPAEVVAAELQARTAEQLFQVLGELKGGAMKFGQAMVQAAQDKADVRAWLVCDRAAIRRYGLGLARPMLPLGSYLRSGYLRSGRTIEDLAHAIAVPADTLRETIAEYNSDAVSGVDTRFGKGSDPFSRFQGDPDVKPNPNMAPLTEGPFYAVEIWCGDFGTFTGLRTNANAQVLDRATGQPIPGLYAAGNDMATMMGSHSVGGGITLGPAMVFGYIAACHLHEGGEAAVPATGTRTAPLQPVQWPAA